MENLLNLSKEEYKSLKIRFGYKITENIRRSLNIINYCKIKNNGN